MLIPDLNYRNYKANEEYNKYLIEKSAENTGFMICQDHSTIWDKVLVAVVFFTLGIAVGSY